MISQKSLAEVMKPQDETQAPQWLIPDLIPPKGVVVLYGPPGIGKTFLVLDLVLTMAWRRSWPMAGDTTERRDRPRAEVLYWIGEGRENAERRTQAWVTHHGASPEDMAFSFVDGYVTGLLLEGRKPRGQAGPAPVVHGLPGRMKHLRDAFSGAEGRTPVLVIDTLSATHPEMDENDTRDAGLVMENCRRLAEELNGIVIIVHHSGKGRAGGPRGHSRMMGDPDTIFHVTRLRKSGQDIIRLHVEKQRMAQAKPDMFFRLHDPEGGLAPVLAAYDEADEAERFKAIRRASALSKSDLKTIKVLNALRRYVTPEEPSFRKYDFVQYARGRHRWSAASIYDHLKKLEEQYRVISAVEMADTPGLRPSEKTREFILKFSDETAQGQITRIRNAQAGRGIPEQPSDGD